MARSGEKRQRKLGTWPHSALAEAREKVRQQSPSSEGDGSLADLIESHLGKLTPRVQHQPATFGGR